MANLNVTLTAVLKYGNGTAATSVQCKAFRVQDNLTAAAINSADTISATSHASTGVVSFTLVCSDTIPVTYKVVFPDGQYAYVRVPANALSSGMGIVVIDNKPSRNVKNITDQVNLVWNGATIASHASNVTPTCDRHVISGTTSITSLTGTNFPVGQILTLTFSGVLTLTDGNNLKMAGNYTTSADDSICLLWDGTDFYELCRSGAV